MGRPRLVLLAALTGAAAGVGGALLTLVLHLVQHLAFGYAGHETFLVGVEHAAPWRRVVGTTVAGAVVGFGWWFLRSRGPLIRVRAALADPARPMPVRRTTADALLQVAAVGGGASVGREGAPREVGALAGGWLAARFGLDPQERRLLLAAGAGAGLAAVYDVPVSGVVFAAIALGSAGVGDVVVLAVASGVATVLAWPVVGRHSVYAVPHVSLGTPGLGELVPWAVVGALPCAAAAIALNVVARRAMGAQPGPSWRLPIATTLAMLSVGVATVWWPGLPGNGKGLVELAIRPAQVSPEAGRAAATFAVLLVLKIVLTGLCLRGGIVGGLLTPALATGAALGAAVGLCLVALTGGGMTVGAETAAVAAYGLVGAAGVLSVSHRSALFATVMVWELTHVAWPVVVACAVCAVLARLAARAVGRG